MSRVCNTLGIRQLSIFPKWLKMGFFSLFLLHIQYIHENGSRECVLNCEKLAICIHFYTVARVIFMSCEWWEILSQHIYIHFWNAWNFLFRFIIPQWALPLNWNSIIKNVYNFEVTSRNIFREIFQTNQCSWPFNPRLLWWTTHKTN